MFYEQHHTYNIPENFTQPQNLFAKIAKGFLQYVDNLIIKVVFGD